MLGLQTVTDRANPFVRAKLAAPNLILCVQYQVHGAAEKTQRVLGVLKTVDMFSQLSASRLTSMAEAMGSRRYAKGENIITQGEEGNFFYILQEGEAIVSVDGNEVARKYAGDGFGAWL